MSYKDKFKNQNELDSMLAFVHDELKSQLELVDSICKKYNIKYCVYYGTLLGAVRHKDIIPWDDDVDLLFTPEELDKFEAAFNIEAPEGYKFGYDGLWVKRLAPKSDETFFGIRKSSISSDFLVLSEVSQNKMRHRCRVLMIKFLQGAIKPKVSWDKGNAILLFAQLFTWGVGKLLPRRFKLGLYERLLNSNSFGNDFFVGNGEFRHLSLVFSKECFESFKAVPFADFELPIMIGYHKVLTTIYGDYMTPPSLSERNQTHIS